MHCNEPHDKCRDMCEVMFKHISNNVKNGEQVSTEMPFVGRFLVRGHTAAF